ncbi:hypothetical protein [Campylobacter sp.]|uniref:hypothetical protein n=1 Tax=Campylobacter sp. TaxID=205 RepID=UPI00361F820B
MIKSLLAESLEICLAARSLKIIDARKVKQIKNTAVKNRASETMLQNSHKIQIDILPPISKTLETMPRNFISARKFMIYLCAFRFFKFITGFICRIAIKKEG